MLRKTTAWCTSSCVAFSFVLSKANLLINFLTFADVCFQTFRGNYDRNGVQTQSFDPPIYGRFVRLYPRGWKSHISLRLELYGCPWSKYCVDCFEISLATLKPKPKSTVTKNSWTSKKKREIGVKRGEYETSAKHAKPFKLCQAREDMQPVPSARKTRHVSYAGKREAVGKRGKTDAHKVTRLI